MSYLFQPQKVKHKDENLCKQDIPCIGYQAM